MLLKYIQFIADNSHMIFVNKIIFFQTDGGNKMLLGQTRCDMRVWFRCNTSAYYSTFELFYFWINPDLKHPTLIDSSILHCIQLCCIYSFQQHESHKTIKTAQAQILRLYFPPHKQVFPSSSSPSQPYVSGYLWWRSVLLSGAFAWRCASSDPLSVPQGQKTLAAGALIHTVRLN